MIIDFFLSSRTQAFLDASCGEAERTSDLLRRRGLDVQVSFLEAHGTSTTVGDMVEGNLACEFFKDAGARPGSIAMGSIKSQIGHLKGAAGAAALAASLGLIQAHSSASARPRMDTSSSSISSEFTSA